MMVNDPLLKESYKKRNLIPVGTRVKLIEMIDDPDPIEFGTEGIVVGSNGNQIYVDWDDGRKLHLLYDIDLYEIIS